MHFGTRKTETITIINATIQQSLQSINQSINHQEATSVLYLCFHYII